MSLKISVKFHKIIASETLLFCAERAKINLAQLNLVK